MHTDFSNLIPLTGNAGTTPVLLLDGSCAYIDLQECADMRLNAARGLLHSLATMAPGQADERDLVHFADAAQLLLADACDLLAAARKAARREAIG
ncbi:hypothetical protein E8F11_22060 [Pseudomonas sp. BN417]|uniref:hypothetical protein n=1 Tax=Pseudomonas sp. BN417 TaxID=2567890 RepID=UPI0024538B48|nr:hypothetical protein [Pseudomonas sp. BN417]MDH4557821.1 hypothetical protein [Pseudomonas sp. BN417]